MLPVSSVTPPMLPNGSIDTTATTPTGRLETPTGQDLAAFHQATGVSVPEVQAQSLPAASSLGSQFSSNVQDVSLRLAEWQKGHATSVTASSPTPDSGLPSLTKTMQQAVAGMQDAYTFAIEATLASHGSTELTKTFNTLLKGQ